ncbi:hypothetical protein WJX72_007796 [[Myrmecia] bisecta]|uniref:MYND-type domain-containing protein n=1 Tax=[Myrmecia] bisecta TaxID=41462 RepID=A0AAW1Q8A7_9CHLO
MESIESWGREDGSLQTVHDWGEATISDPVCSSSDPPLDPNSLPVMQMQNPRFQRNMIAWWAALPVAAREEFVALVVWFAEETLLPEPGTSTSLYHPPVEPGMLEAFELCGGATDRAAVVQDFLDSLGGWKAMFVPAEADAPAETSIAEHRTKGFRMLLWLGETFCLTVKRGFKSQQVRERQRETYCHFRHFVVKVHQDGSMDVRGYCSRVGLADILQCAELPVGQLARFITHMTALMWTRHILKALYCCEVVSRGRVMFDWGPKHICNRLACPVSQAYLTAQQPPARPNVRLAFEFAGQKLRKCSGCEQAWYCTAECQKARGQARPPPVLSAAERERQAREHKDRGNALFREGNWSGASICYRRSLDVLPTSVAFANKAAAQLKLRNWQQAVEDCTDALRLDPGAFKALSRRCDAFLELGRPEDALADLRELYSQRPFEAAELEGRELQGVRIRAGQMLQLLVAATDEHLAPTDLLQYSPG